MPRRSADDEDSGYKIDISLKLNVSFDEVKHFRDEVNRQIGYTETIIKSPLVSMNRQIP
jgi:hypothetical protein